MVEQILRPRRGGFSQGHHLMMPSLARRGNQGGDSLVLRSFYELLEVYKYAFVSRLCRPGFWK